MPNPHEREVAVFEAALNLPPDQRQAYLEQTCAGDRDLLQRILALLKVNESQADFLSPTTSIPLSEKTGDRIGPYKLLQQIGEGGCGVVYMAEQDQPIRRRVALKIVKLGMDTKQVIARFEAERQALALMDHPNIAKVHDAGATATGRPYFVMELVRGLKITDYCDEKKLSTQQRLELFTTVCQAVQHAHQKGIIHRDLKPSNVLVTVNDGMAVAKVIDFGIAKATSGERLTDKTIFTAFEQFIGTPAYMSPEQAEITSTDIDTRSDIYSLGVLLYELLTGQTPFDVKELLQSGLDEMRRTLREKEPARPSTRLSTLGAEDLTTAAHRRSLDAPKLVTALRGDLDWIVMKCLEKDRARRYETANGLAMDIQRHLKNEPVMACPPSRLYEFQKIVRRHKFGFAATGAVIAALIAGLIIAVWSLQMEKAATKKAAKEAAKSKAMTDFFEEMLKGAGPAVAKGRDTTVLKEITDRAAVKLATALAQEPEVNGELSATIGGIYSELGKYDDAERILQRALTNTSQALGEENETVSALFNNLGGVLQAEGKLHEAELAESNSLWIARRVVGPQHEDVVDAESSLAETLQAEHELPEAEVMMRDALAMEQKLSGPENENAANLLHNLGGIYWDEHRYGEAEGTFRNALTMETKILGETHPMTVASLNGLAMALEAENKLAEAEEVFRHAITLARQLYGEGHPKLAISMHNLAKVLELEQKLPESEEMSRNALVILQTEWPAGHPSVAAALSQLADTLQDEEHYSESEASYRRSLEMRRQFAGERDPSVAATMLSLAAVLRAENKRLEAESIAREALAIREATQPGDWHTFFASALLGSILLDEEKFGAAQSQLAPACAGLVQRRTEIPSAANVKIKKEFADLVALYGITGQTTLASEWKAKLTEFDTTNLNESSAHK